MPKEYGYRYSDTCASLRDALQEVRGSIRVAESNVVQREAYMSKRACHANNLKWCNWVTEALKPLISKTKEYSAEKKKMSIHNINNALRIAGEIVPDATTGIKFELDNDSATIVTETGCEAEIIEGGGYRQTSSVLINSIILQAAPGYLQTMFLDEPFALLNSENSATLSICLELMGKNVQILSIEQKNDVYSNMNHREYLFTKSEKWTSTSMTDKKIHEEGDLDEIQTY